jgi:hypothetical protein
MRIIFLFLFFYAFNLYAQQSSGVQETKSFVELASRIDWQCMQVKISACPTPKPPYVGVRWQYWEPSLFMETVKSPGDYVIREIGLPLRQELRAFNRDKTSTGSAQAFDGSNLQFNEAHLYDFPLKILEQAVMCPSTLGDNLMIRYLSELNSDNWRKGILEPRLSLRLGNWGPLYPRIGFLAHFSSLVASATTCVRAVNLIGAGPNIIMDKVQMVYPYKTSCIPIGSNMALYDGLHSKDGRYVWIFFRYRDCCRSVAG